MKRRIGEMNELLTPFFVAESEVEHCPPPLFRTVCRCEALHFPPPIFFSSFFFFVVCVYPSKISSSPLRSRPVARHGVTLSKVITVVTNGYRFPLVLRHNLFNWCQSWGPYAESPENAHADRRAHLLTL